MSSFATAAFREAIYLAGGFDSNGTRREVIRLDVNASEWVRVADLPDPRFSLVLVPLGDSLYAIGGSADDRITRSVYVYAADRNEWVGGAEMSRRRNSHAAVSVGDQIVVVGGVAFDDLGNASTLDSLEIYNPATGEWRSGSPLPTPRLKPKVGVVDGSVYVFGGTNPEAAEALVTTVEVYDIATDSWRATTTLPGQQQGFGSVTIGEQIHLVGGNSPFGDRATVSEIVSQHNFYTPAENAWSSLMPGLTPRVELALVKLGPDIFAIGGVTQVQPYTATDLVEIFRLGDVGRTP